jgi:hypothetical protein
MNRIDEIRNEAAGIIAAAKHRYRNAALQALTEASGAGMTAAEAARYTGISYGHVHVIAKRLGLKFSHAPRSRFDIRRDNDPAIDIRQSVKDTALANRGKASAAQIGAAIGVTRNSIIGYWNRARASGELAA